MGAVGVRANLDAGTLMTADRPVTVRSLAVIEAALNSAEGMYSVLSIFCYVGLLFT